MTKHRVLGVLFVACLAPACSDGEHGVVDDPGFDRWCEHGLCSWEADGNIRRVPTWHEKDFGVELEGVPTTLSQEIDVNTQCVKFGIVANVEAEANLELALDLLADDAIEHVAPIPRLDWEPYELLVQLPPISDLFALRITFRKSGDGRVVLGGFSVDLRQSCPNAPVRVRLGLGSACSDDRSCGSGFCPMPATIQQYGDARCGECVLDDDCGSDLICGVEQSSPFFKKCIGPATIQREGVCNRNEECATGACSSGRCRDAVP